MPDTRYTVTAPTPLRFAQAVDRVGRARCEISQPGSVSPLIVDAVGVEIVTVSDFHPKGLL